MNVLEYLDRTEKRLPDKPALIDETETVTYRELKRRSESIGTAILHRLDCKNRPVLVMIDRNAASVSAFLGIARSRNFYVPVDAGQPVTRLRTIIDTLRPVLILTIHGNMPAGLSPEGICVLDYDEIVDTPADPVLLASRASGIIDTDPLYAITTSGSTGIPKTVLIAHRSVLDFIPVFTSLFDLREEDIFGNQAPFDFDVSVKDLYSSFYLGSTVYIIPKACFVMPKMLVEVLDKYHVTTLIWAVSALCVAAGFQAFQYIVPHAIKKVMFSGEVMPVKMLNIWRKYYPEAMFVNLYGPTEITCNCMYYIIDRDFADTDKLPLGVPFPNEEILILNEKNEPVTQGETGEICVRGTCLALGYYRNDERTAAAFVQNPLHRDYPDLIYRTGDLACLGEDGEYYFAARKDFQIKHMGHRIELEEIEVHLGALPGVTQACCFFDEKKNKIVACYTGEIEKREMLRGLREKLPKYMLPNVVRKLERLPLTKNGKTDRKALRREYESE